MTDEICSWSDCCAEAVAWIDAGPWCGHHAMRVLAGDRPTQVDGATDADSVSEVRRVANDAA